MRRPSAWQPGDYELDLTRKEALGESDWFDRHVIELASNTDVYVGGIRVPRATAGMPATVVTAVDTFHEVYLGAKDYGKIPRWHVGVMLSADGVQATTARSEYPLAWPNEPIYPNADIWLDVAAHRVNIVAGGQTPKCHAAGVLF